MGETCSEPAEVPDEPPGSMSAFAACSLPRSLPQRIRQLRGDAGDEKCAGTLITASSVTIAEKGPRPLDCSFLNAQYDASGV